MAPEEQRRKWSHVPTNLASPRAVSSARSPRGLLTPPSSGDQVVAGATVDPTLASHLSSAVWRERSGQSVYTRRYASPVMGGTKSSLGDTKSSLGDAKSSLGDAKSPLGDAKSSLGDAKSPLGDTLRARWVTLRARWMTR
jgi:hypothetical protein